MELKPYLKQLTDEQVEKLAASCETSAGHLSNVGYGYKSCSPALAVAIERESGCAVRRWELRPQDWFAIWPELVGTKGAPKAPMRKAA